MIYREYVCNLHIHSQYSDGAADYPEIIHHAQRAGLDVIIVTDHNSYPEGEDGWYGNTLVLTGQEVNRPDHEHVNHLLVFDAGEDVVDYADDPALLIERVRVLGGLSFLAHPFERADDLSGEPEIPWQRWDVSGYTGIELWNYMSEFKSYMREPLSALLYILWPRLAMTGPFPETVAKWDHLLGEGHAVYAVGGSDAHGTLYQLGPIRWPILGYRHLFNAVNTHLLLTDGWTGDVERDGALVYDALSHGRAFIGYDGLGSTRGFRFWAERRDDQFEMGQAIRAGRSAEFVVLTPALAHIRLMLNGFCVAEVAQGTELRHTSRTPGIYRVEAYRRYALKERAWILSNPIMMQV